MSVLERLKRGDSRGALQRQQALLAEAKKHLGYEAPLQGSIFAARAGYPGTEPWSGYFADCCLYDAGLWLPSCQWGLWGFSRAPLLARPSPGTLAVFSAITPHLRVGIVSRVNRDGSFDVIEGSVPRTPGSPPRAVASRTHQPGSTIGFMSPLEIPAADSIDVSRLTSETTARLCVMLGISTRAVWDQAARDAYSGWQLACGYNPHDATGIPDQNSADLLARVTATQHA